MDTSKTSDPGYPMPSVTSEGFHPGLGSPTMPDEPIGGLERLAIEWNPDATSCHSCGQLNITFPHSCYPVSDITKIEPNRFDPYEALDELLELSPLAGTRRNVGLLRAYITGMEK